MTGPDAGQRPAGAGVVLVLSEPTITRVNTLVDLSDTAVRTGTVCLLDVHSHDRSALATRFADAGFAVDRRTAEDHDPLAGWSLRQTLELIRRAFQLSADDQHPFAVWCALAADAHSVDPGRFPGLSSGRIAQLATDEAAQRDAREAIASCVGSTPRHYETTGLSVAVRTAVGLLATLPGTSPVEPTGLRETRLPATGGPLARLWVSSELDASERADLTVIADADQLPGEAVSRRTEANAGRVVVVSARPERFGQPGGYALDQLAGRCTTLIVGRLTDPAAAQTASSLLSRLTVRPVFTREVRELPVGRVLIARRGSVAPVLCQVKRSGLA